MLIPIIADPDAIACAMAVKRLLWRKTAGVTIANINTIKRPDNRAMIQRLGVSIKPFCPSKCQDYSRYVLVDAQPDHNEAFSRITPHVVIDHHPDTEFNADFVDVRPTYGATATILTEYIRAAKIKPSAKLAAGLYYAIKTDTSNFERQTVIEDMRAFQFLFRHANIQLARKMEQSDLTWGFLKYFDIAFQNRRVRKDRLYVHLGTVANPDICVILADFFMRVDKVNWSFVSSIYGKKLVIILRNDGLRLNAGNLAKTCFGAYGSAGGHKSMARAELQLDKIEPLVDTDQDNKLQRWIIKQVEQRTRK